MGRERGGFKAADSGRICGLKRGNTVYSVGDSPAVKVGVRGPAVIGSVAGSGGEASAGGGLSFAALAPEEEGVALVPATI